VAEWFFTSDLHGQTTLYEQLVGLVAAHTPRAVIIGGDLAPHAGGADGVATQRVFLEGTLVEFARRLREGSPATELLLLMGNDDWAANMDCLERNDGRCGACSTSARWRWTTCPSRDSRGCRSRRSGSRTGSAGRTAPAEHPARPGRLDEPRRRGRPVRVSTRRGARRPLPTRSRSLASRTTAGDTVCVTHSPPRDTRCDMIGARAHVGSRAIRQFIEVHQPPLLLSGHIHESPRVSASYRDTIGVPIVVNPGQFGTSRLCGVWFVSAARRRDDAPHVYP